MLLAPKKGTELPNLLADAFSRTLVTGKAPFLVRTTVPLLIRQVVARVVPARKPAAKPQS
jgi:hypothetical protein